MKRFFLQFIVWPIALLKKSLAKLLDRAAELKFFLHLLVGFVIEFYQIFFCLSAFLLTQVKILLLLLLFVY